jgi:hypothetical protein
MNDDIKNKILAEIQSGQLKQRPRWYFVLRGTLVGIGIGLVFCLVLYLASFILFILRQTGVWFVPAFGFRGWFVFFRSLPWLLIALSAIFIIVLELLVRRYAFAYREPLVYSVFGIVLVVFAGGFLLFETSLHRALFLGAEHNNVPSPIGILYRGYGAQRFDDIHAGQIVATTSGGFVLQEAFDNSTATVLVASDTALPTDVLIMPSDTVVVFGSEANDIIQAVGIREAAADIMWSPLPPPPVRE